MKEIKGTQTGRGIVIAIAVAQFNEFVTQRLLSACLDELKRLGVLSKNICVVHVPGAFELPVAALKLARKKRVNAVICLGCVIRGETRHYELVVDGARQGIMSAAMQTGRPVIFGVLATETVKHATERAKVKGDNKGRDAAQAAVSMATAFQQIERLSI